MTDLDIRIMLSTEVLKHIKDESIQNIVRSIIFNRNNVIDWRNVLEEIHRYMPELIKEDN
jgi:hypothetical protein